MVRKGQILEWVTLLSCVTEAAAGLAAGLQSHSLSLMSFGLDSLIETASALAIMWRLSQDVHARHAAEKLSLRVIGACFYLLALYVSFESIAGLINHSNPTFTLLGFCLTLFSICVMPALARAKYRVATQLDSNAIRADAQRSALCGYLAVIALLGLIANGLFALWWADPVASLCMVPIIVIEGKRALEGKSCPHCG